MDFWQTRHAKDASVFDVVARFCLNSLMGIPSPTRAAAGNGTWFVKSPCRKHTYKKRGLSEPDRMRS